MISACTVAVNNDTSYHKILEQSLCNKSSLISELVIANVVKGKGDPEETYQIGNIKVTFSCILNTKECSMNLFILDLDPVKAAEQNCDKHVCKIILEAADCLATAHWETGGMPASAPSFLTTPRVRQTKSGNMRRTIPYYPQSHVNNHVTVWVRTAIENYRWTARHGLALCVEYSRRYDKMHATEQYLEWFKLNEPDLPAGSTPFRQAVAREPLDCCRSDVVLAYKLYYAYYKCGFARWRSGNTPQWYVQMRDVIGSGGSLSQVEAAA